MVVLYLLVLISIVCSVSSVYTQMTGKETWVDFIIYHSFQLYLRIKEILSRFKAFLKRKSKVELVTTLLSIFIIFIIFKFYG